MIISTLNRMAQTRKNVFPKSFAILLAIFFALTTSWVNAQTATIATDKEDYAPGTTATITGTGFQAWVSRSDRAHSGEAGSPTRALREAVETAEADQG